MNQNAYQQFLKYKNVGRKAEAKAALAVFLDSVEPSDDIQSWVKDYLENDDYGHKIRHEIYERLIFPVLLRGYEQGDAWSLLWLAKTSDNLQDNSALYKRIGSKSPRSMLEEHYANQPTEEVRQMLLEMDLKWYRYSQHEWPTGILSGPNYASLAECDELLQDITRARNMDMGSNTEFLDSYEAKVRTYISRLRKR